MHNVLASNEQTLAHLQQTQTDLVVQQQLVQQLHDQSSPAIPENLAPATGTMFLTNLFNGDINPTTSNDLKLFPSGIAARDVKLEANFKNSKAFLE